jgi:hypothetical protein
MAIQGVELTPNKDMLPLHQLTFHKSNFQLQQLTHCMNNGPDKIPEF